MIYSSYQGECSVAYKHCDQRNSIYCILDAILLWFCIVHCLLYFMTNLLIRLHGGLICLRNIVLKDPFFFALRENH